MSENLIHPLLLRLLLTMYCTIVNINAVSAMPPEVVRISDKLPDSRDIRSEITKPAPRAVRISDKVPEGKVSSSSRSATLENAAASTPVFETFANPGSSQMAAKNSRPSKITTVSKPSPATAGDSGSDPPNHLTNTLRTIAQSTDNKDGGGASRFQKQPESIELSLPGDAPESLLPMAAVPAGRSASRGGIQQISYEMTDVESGQTPRAGTQQSSPNWLPRSTIVGPANAPTPSDNSANAPMALPASRLARTPPPRLKQNNSSVTGAPSGPETSTSPTDVGVPSNAAGSQTLSGPSADPFPRVEREPQQFPIQRGIPAPRNASLSILERQAQVMTEVEARPGDAIAAAGEQSATTPTATKSSSGPEMTGVPSLPSREQRQRDQNADARVGSSNPVPEIGSHPKSQQHTGRRQRGAMPSPGNSGNVIEIWYGERQVFQSRNAPTGRPTESIAHGVPHDKLVTTPDDQKRETDENEENQSRVSVAAATGATDTTGDTRENGETPENKQLDLPVFFGQLQKSDREPELEDVGNPSGPKHANDDSKPFIPWTHATSELAPVPLKGPKDFPQGEEKQGRKFQPVVNRPFPDASGDETGRPIRQTKFEDAKMAASSGLSPQVDNLQRGGMTQAANSTEHADTNDESLWRNHQGHIPQTDAAQSLASPGQLIWPVVAIAFGLLFGVAIVFLFLVIAVRLIRPGHPQPLCNVSVVNGDRTVESDSEYAAFQGQMTTADQGTQRGLAAQNRVSHPPRRIRHNEPQPPVRNGFAKRTTESAMHDSGGFRPTVQPEPPATEPLVSHDGMMNDILRQNRAIRDQQPRKWVEN